MGLCSYLEDDWVYSSSGVWRRIASSKDSFLSPSSSSSSSNLAKSSARISLALVDMGLSSFPSAAEGVLPVLVMNTVLSVAPLKNMVRSVIQVVGANWAAPDHEEEPGEYPQENARERRISITQFKSLNHNNGGARRRTMECSVCLCGFESEEEVSELSCKHFFHRGCLDKWFDNKHSTCPLCRSNI